MKAVAYKIDIIQPILVKTLTVLLFCTFFVYMYLIAQTASNAASHNNMTGSLVDTKSNIGELEYAYIERNSQISKDMSTEFGLVPVLESDIVFVQRDVNTKLSLNE